MTFILVVSFAGAHAEHILLGAPVRPPGGGAADFTDRRGAIHALLW